jgi:predicted small lipoprotein YifL
MKRIISALLIVAMVACLAACAAKLAEPSEMTQPPQATAEPSVEPEREPYTPMDIFSDEFNPAGMDMPTTVFQATFGKDKVEGKSRFVLSMTGSGDMYGCVAFQADVAGLSEDEKHERINEYLEGGYCHIDGTDGRWVDIKQADQNDDRYEYVEADGQHGQNGAGCVIDITYIIDDADIEKYTQLVRDNYSVDALMPIAGYFDTNTDFAECGINVNVYKGEARAYAVYYLPDVESVMRDMQAGGDAPWWEWNGMTQTSFMYEGVESKLTFDTEGGAITVEQMNTQLNTTLGSEASLTKLGFGFDDAGVCGVYEEHEPFYSSVAVARPEWGEFSEDWNMEFNDSNINGYSVIMWYYADEDRYEIQADKDNVSSKYTYFTKGELDFCYPDTDTVRKMFNPAFGTEGDSFYHAPFEHFEQYVQERFMLSVDELYAAPKQ